MDKAFQIQKQVRDNANTLNSYLTDLQNWESEMKRKETALNGGYEQDLPPVRSKVKKEKPVQVKKQPEKRISSSDYKAWENFDVDKACEDIDMEDKGPTSLDSKKSLPAKMEKLREEAQYEKERGNTFVKQKKWDDAIGCYNRAIELVKDDAIYYANRGLCYLKKDSLHQAESDCTEALHLDPTYVKALQRRATAREKLGSLRSASADLAEVLRLEPHNKSARAQLDAIKARMGTKGAKSKSSPSTTPIIESKPFISKPKHQPKIIELPDEPKPVTLLTAEENWRLGIGENVTVLRPVKKPPHLRSKRPLKPVLIQEIQLGKTSPEKPPTRLKIVEIEDQSWGDTKKDNIDVPNNDGSRQQDIFNQIDGGTDIFNQIDDSMEIFNEIDDSAEFFNQINGSTEIFNQIDGSKKLLNQVYGSKKNFNLDDGSANIFNVDSTKIVKKNPKDTASPESVKLITDARASEKENRLPALVAPNNSVQFMSQWKYLNGNEKARSDYLSIIEPLKIPSIFENALESDVLSEVLRILASDTSKFAGKSVGAYLSALSRVKRFTALAMFLSDNDKQLLTKLLEHCKTAEKMSDKEIADLKNKYEL